MYHLALYNSRRCLRSLLFSFNPWRRQLLCVTSHPLFLCPFLLFPRGYLPASLVSLEANLRPYLVTGETTLWIISTRFLCFRSRAETYSRKARPLPRSRARGATISSRLSPPPSPPLSSLFLVDARRGGSSSLGLAISILFGLASSRVPPVSLAAESLVTVISLALYGSFVVSGE